MKASLRRLPSFQGRRGSEISSEIRAVEGPIILAIASPFPCVLREGYSRDWVNDQPGWESPIHVVSSQKGPILNGLEEKSRLGIEELNPRKRNPNLLITF
ncbi:hypothetical protein AVEN_1704-1 [Araneus ventricosus]|uniref:Uncharacterized protein n=1 Tax=Araneus ventricosus TaxID=182803 RepID=A0A4Y2KJM0_ARAVE|nr:hypothetical protein AVEN_1704-1 [Araneus ventricosus]